jgi:predicted dehydrogenase
MTPLRAGIIGCGAIAYEHLPFVATSPRATLIGVCDKSEALAKVAGDRFRADAAYTNVEELLAKGKPDIVHVLTPPHTHDFIVRQALAYGAHVICEKPMTGDAVSTAALLAEADKAGRVLMESRNLIFNDAVIEIQSMIADDKLGSVVECDILLSLDFLAGPFGDPNLSGPGVVLPGGAVHDFLPHLVYLFLAITKADGDCAIKGFLQNRSQNERAGFDFLDALIDYGISRGRLRVATDAFPASFKLIVRGTKGTVETDLYNPYMRFEAAPNVGKRAPLGQIANGKSLIGAGFANFRNKVMQHGTTHGLPRMLDTIYDAIISGGQLPFTNSEMLATAKLTDRLIALGESK